MNEIIEQLIDWCNENHYGIKLAIYSAGGGQYLKITLGYEHRVITHEFYFGGVMCSESWKEYNRDIELREFLKQAKIDLKGENNDL